MLVALGVCKWVFTGIDTDSGLSFAYPAVNANAQSSIKELGQKILHQYDSCYFFRLRNTLNSP